MGSSPGKKLARHCLVDDDDRPSLGLVFLFGESPPAEDGNPHGLEERRLNDAGARLGRIAWGMGPALNVNCDPNAASTERKGINRSGRLYAGKRLEFGHDAAVKGQRVGVLFIAFGRDAYAEGQHMAGVESGIDGKNVKKAANQEPGSDEQDQSEGGFHDYQAGVQPVLLASGGRGAAAITQRQRGIETRELAGGQ